VASTHRITTGIGPRPAAELARRLPARAWQRLSAGPGAKGQRWYDWALIDTTDPAVTDGTGPHWLLIRRRISDGEYAFYRAHAPRPVPLAQLVRVAGSRWRIEDGFAAGKELAGLDEHQVRCWTSWHRWTILALLAHAFLSVLVAAQPADGHGGELVPLTRNEIRRLFTGLRQQPPAPRLRLDWPRWRRRHQATARACHYRRSAHTCMITCDRAARRSRAWRGPLGAGRVLAGRLPAGSAQPRAWLAGFIKVDEDHEMRGVHAVGARQGGEGPV
jgi:hypothetical protein